MTDTPTLKPCPTKADFTEAFDMTHRLIQEAKPREGYITDHLDAAECWLDNLEEMLDAYRTRQPTQNDALREALERIEAATRNEVRAGDKGYISRYGINGIARAALEARGFEIREKGQ